MLRVASKVSQLTIDKVSQLSTDKARQLTTDQVSQLIIVNSLKICPVSQYIGYAK
jgi:hypothetical protein